MFTNAEAPLQRYRRVINKQFGYTHAYFYFLNPKTKSFFTILNHDDDDFKDRKMETPQMPANTQEPGITPKCPFWVPESQATELSPAVCESVHWHDSR